VVETIKQFKIKLKGHMYRTTFFLIKEDKYFTEIIYAVKHCKRPAATKAYKSLIEMFNEGKIEGYGWKRN